MPDAAIDRDTFAELQATAGEQFVAELVDTFVDEAPAMFDELRAALDAADAAAFRRAAHSIKSNANTFGATTLGEMARALELGGLPADAAPLDALSAEFDRASAALKGLCGG